MTSTFIGKNDSSSMRQSFSNTSNSVFNTVCLTKKRKHKIQLIWLDVSFDWFYKNSKVHWLIWKLWLDFARFCFSIIFFLVVVYFVGDLCVDSAVSPSTRCMELFRSRSPSPQCNITHENNIKYWPLLHPFMYIYVKQVAQARPNSLTSPYTVFHRTNRRRIAGRNCRTRRDHVLYYGAGLVFL